MEDARARGRRDYERRTWADAHDALSQASAERPLEADDVERLAWSAVLSGRDEASLEALERLHQLRLEAGEVLRAARAGFWLAMRLFSLGDVARASGWLARAQRLVEREGGDCVERGYLHISDGDPGVDRGTGWTQLATLTLDGAVVIASAAAPFEILEGALVAGEHHFGNLVPLPFDATESVRFEVTGSNGQRLSVRADSASICLEGKPTYVEDFEP